MRLDEVKPGIKVRVVSDDGTIGMLISEEHLSLRKIGEEGVVETYVPGHGGDVWFVRQNNGVAVYYFTEIELCEDQ